MIRKSYSYLVWHMYNLNHMVIFNQTFSDDKPVYFPDNWRTGKTQSQLY